MKTRALLSAILFSTLSSCAPHEPEAQAESVAKTKPQGSSQANCAPPSSIPYPTNKHSFNAYTRKVRDALGYFKDITVFERENDIWQPTEGIHYVPVTVNSETPEYYTPHMRSDRPMLLPIDVQGSTTGDGQSVPNTVVGRVRGSNPEVQWVFAVRHYRIRQPDSDDFTLSEDMAVIGHHPRTGASTYYQFYNPNNPKSGQIITSPFSPNGYTFWPPIETIAQEYRCERCHSTDAFIHSPWIDQLRVGDAAHLNSQPIVPGNPLGPFFYIDADPGGLFSSWNYALKHYNNADNSCTHCHRVSPYDLIGLNQNASAFAGVAEAQKKADKLPCYIENAYTAAKEAHHNQTDGYYQRFWMPPSSLNDFYGPAPRGDEPMQYSYTKDAAEVNLLRQDSAELIDVPSPPPEYRSILVDRPEQLTVAGGEAVWLLDSRMRANTDTTLDSWKFVSKSASTPVLVAPVVYRRSQPNGAKFQVQFVGKPRGYTEAKKWLTVTANSEAVPVELGDYFGLVLINPSDDPALAPVPHSNDQWARNAWQAWDKKRLPAALNGYVVYQQSDTASVAKTATASSANGQAPGTLLSFPSSGVPPESLFRTYSFEFQSKL